MKELVRLRYENNMSLNDICSALNRSLSWAKVNLFRVKKTLFECIEGKLAAKP